MSCSRADADRGGEARAAPAGHPDHAQPARGRAPAGSQARPPTTRRRPSRPRRCMRSAAARCCSRAGMAAARRRSTSSAMRPASSASCARASTPRHTHGTGCTLSAAIAALLAQGVALREAVARAKAFVWQALEAGRRWASAMAPARSITCSPSAACRRRHDAASGRRSRRDDGRRHWCPPPKSLIGDARVDVHQAHAIE